MINQKIKYLLREDSDRLLASITNVRDKAIFTVSYWHGLRASEVGMLKLSDWKARSGRIYINRVKGSDSGEFLLADGAYPSLVAWLKDRGDWEGPLFPSEQRGPISRYRLHQLMRQYGERAGIDADLRHFHTLRHSIAVHMTEDGEDLPHIQEWLGHRSILSTMKYARLTNRARDARAKAYFKKRAGVADKPPVKWGRNKR